MVATQETTTNSEAPTTTTEAPMTEAAPDASTTVTEATPEGSTSFPPLVPCPEPCPAESGYFEVEPCSAFYCSCTNGIGYLQV